MLLLLVSCWSTPRPERAAPVAQTAAPVRFIAIGDTGKANHEQRRVASAIGKVCADKPCDFALLLGDNLYPSGLDSPADPRMKAAFTDIYAGLDLLFYAVLGNHDYDRGIPEKAQHQIDYAATDPHLHLPSPTYTFSAAQSTFWALDTDDVFFNGHEAQAAWLDAEIPVSEARWRVVFGHHPYRSNGGHGNAGAYEGWRNLPYVSGNALWSLFDGHVKDQADLYLSGHDHNLQLMTHEGLPLVVSGAGASVRPLIDRGNALDLGYASLGFAWVELGESLTVEFWDDKAQLLGRQVLPHPRLRP